MERDPKQRCVDGRFFHPFDHNDSGECRQAPPQIVAIEREEDGSYRGFWPEVYVEEWCGAFEPLTPDP